MRRPLLLLLAGALAVSACSNTTSDGNDGATDVPVTSAPMSSTSGVGFPLPTLEWTECGDNLQCATLVAPLDYTDPAGESVRLTVTRHLARKPKQRIGSLLVNPGGPGLDAKFLVEAAPAMFTEDLLNRFDIVGMDPRGTGGSTPSIDCIDEYDPYFAAEFPDTPEGKEQDIALVKKLADACYQRSGDLLAHVSTLDVARDMDLLRRVLGEDRISYFGFSYGSELGAAWVTMFPSSVRAAVFDGAVDPTASGMQESIDQARGFESALTSFLEFCSEKCSFPAGRDPGSAFDEIISLIDRGEIPTSAGRPSLNLSITYSAIANALYSEMLWPQLDGALDAAEDGDGGPMLSLYDDYYRRRQDGTYPNLIEAFIAISCADDRGPTTVEGVDAYYDEILAAAPRLAPAFRGGYACVFWPVPSAPTIELTGRGAGPILVIGTTNDPATPLAGTQKMADTMEGGVLITVAGEGHLGYRQSKCARELVDDYLVDGKVPSADVTCD